MNSLLNTCISKEMYAKMGEKRHFILLPVNFFLPVTPSKRILPVNQLTGDEMKSLIVDVNGDLQLFHSSPCYINVRENVSRNWMASPRWGLNVKEKLQAITTKIR